MSLHLAEIAKTVAPGAYAALPVNQADWHLSGALSIPPNITIVPLPAKCPELNPQENVWQFMRENWLSNRVFNPTTTSSLTDAGHGTVSSTSHGASCPSASGNGTMRSHQGDLV
jgi:hypothetical protein